MQEQHNEQPKRRRKKKKNHFFQYFLLFACIFALTLFGLSYIVDSFSPDVDVAIGNSEPITLSDSDIALEEKTIDERLKWIQEEDELPSAGEKEPKLLEPDNEYNNDSTEDSGRNKAVIEAPKKKDYDEKPKKTDNNTEEKVKKAPAPNKQQIDYIKADFRKAAENSGVIPLPKKTDMSSKSSINKVIVGTFSSVDEATVARDNIIRERLNIIPFIKKTANGYVIQAGTFDNKDNANELASQLRSKGYSAKVQSDN